MQFERVLTRITWPPKSINYIFGVWCPDWLMRWRYSCKQPKYHPLVVLTGKNTVTCLCGEVVGQYTASRDMHMIVWERTDRTVYDDAEAAQAARWQWEDEIVRQQGGGHWEWETVYSREYNAGGEMESSTPEKKRVFKPIVPTPPVVDTKTTTYDAREDLLATKYPCGCEYANAPGHEFKRLCDQHSKPDRIRAVIALGEEV